MTPEGHRATNHRPEARQMHSRGILQRLTAANEGKLFSNVSRVRHCTWYNPALPLAAPKSHSEAEVSRLEGLESRAALLFLNVSFQCTHPEIVFVS
jgi:hypothetical protein